jgi:hypothetical protein
MALQTSGCAATCYVMSHMPARAAVFRRRERRPWLLGLLGLGAYAYVRAPLRRLRARAPALAPRELAAAVALIPLIRLVGDVAKMVGYPVGVLRRLCSPTLRQAIAAYGMPTKT